MTRLLTLIVCWLLLGAAVSPDALEDLVLRWAPIPDTQQEGFFDDDTPDANLLLRAGWGAGKTMTLTAKMLKLSAINAPLPGLWCVPDYNHVEDTILPLLQELDAATIDPITGLGEPWFLRSDQFRYRLRGHVLRWVGGGPIQFVSAENPKTIAGPNVAFCGTDEPGSISYEAWRNTSARVRHVNARLRQRVAAGTSEGLGFLDDLFGPERTPNYHLYEMETTENVELVKASPAFVQDMMATMTEAEIANYIAGRSVNTTGALAHPTFNAELHWRLDVPPADPAHPLRLAFDFNVNPMVCIIGQQLAGPYGQEARVTDAVVLYGGSTVDQTCDELLVRYPRWRAGLIIYGDATGKARSVKSLRSNYDIIKERLQPIGAVTLKVPTENPPVKRRLNSVNRMFRNALGHTRLWIRKTAPAQQCPTRELVRSLQRTQKKSGTDDILKKSGETITHPSEALGYWIDYEFPAEKPRRLVGWA